MNRPDSTKLIYIVDLNDLRDGSVTTVAMDFTLDYGPRVMVTPERPLAVGDLVKICDDEDCLYWAKVEGQVSPRSFSVRIDWDSCAPVLNQG